jgi:type IV pilus assembly protein PilW
MNAFAQNGLLRVPRASSGPRQRGFSLIELMVALTLALLILVGLSALFANTSVARSEIDKASRQIENGRFALQTLGDDIRHAGYYGALSNAPAAPTIWPNDPCSTVLSDVRDAIGLPVQGYAGGAVAPLTCLDGYKPQTGVVVVRRASTAVPAAAAAASAFNIQVSGCAGDASPYLLDTPSGTFNLHSNLAPGCLPLTGAPAAGISPFFVRIYYISCNTDSAVACGAAGADGVPTLQRIDVTPLGADPTPVVDGIEDMQFDYGMDSDAVGTAGYGAPDIYTNTAAHVSLTPTNVAEWEDVLSVKVYLLARNIDRTGSYADVKTYSLGPVSLTPGGPYKRHAYAEVVRLNNPAGRRE